MKLALRIALIIICSLSLLIGLALGGIGVGILANKTKLRSMINLIDVGEMEMLEKYKKDVGDLIDKYDVISRVGMAFLALGFLVSLVSTLGLAGACMLQKFVLYVYTGLMSILLMAVLGVVIYCGVFKQEIANKMKDRMHQLQDKYFISIVELLSNKETEKAMLTLAINFMHFSLRCCGIRKVGDARNSTSWLKSERRIMQLMETGADLFQGTKTSDYDYAVSSEVRHRRSAIQSDMYDYTIFDNSGSGGGKGQPDWMRYDVPEELEMPDNYAVPTMLPDGFEIDEDVFEGLTEVVEEVVTETVKVVTEVLDEALVMRTPLTCCQMESIKKLLENEFDVSQMYDSMEEISCIFEEENFGVNNQTCYVALWNYLDQYVTPVLALGSLLIILMNQCCSSCAQRCKSCTCSVKLALRIALIIICSLSLLIGLALGGIGVGILANKTKLRSMINLIDVGEMEMLEKYKKDVGDLIDKYDVISRVGMAFIALGFLVSLVSTLGLAGACMLQKFVLYVYTGLMSILLMAILGVVVYCGIFKERIAEKMKDRMLKLQDKYFVSVIELVQNNSTVKAMLTLAVNFMHFSLRCCGIRNVGDARNSTSWKNSERRLMQLMAAGADLYASSMNGENSNDYDYLYEGLFEARYRRSAIQSDMYDYTIFDYSDYGSGASGGAGGGQAQPDWMRYDVPPELTMPPDYAVPDMLPGGFEIDEDLFEGLTEVVEEVVTETVNAVTEALDSALVLRTPLTCCQMEGIKKLLANEFDVSQMYDSMEEISCIFEEENFGVNNQHSNGNSDLVN
uniref:Tetraspanin n=1 Tax=Macrostomum lignano TaxID=282301 RepID=A0A1I8JCT8_9PLAT